MPMKIRYPIIFLLIICLGFTALAAHAFTLEDKVKRHVLANGLTVLIVERPLCPTVAFEIRHRVGAVDEESGKTGLAHFLEHMLFKGTRTIGVKDCDAEAALLDSVYIAGKALDAERRKGSQADPALIEKLDQVLAEAQKKADALTIKNELDRLYTENGSSQSNAATGQDMTTYTVSLPANKIELWARLESDRMRHPVFREFYTERKVIREERRQSIESNPSRILLERFLETAFSRHPYARPVIGKPDDMEFLDIDDLRAFFKTYYAPNNTVVAVVGAVKAPAVIFLMEKYFGSIPPVLLPALAPASEPQQKSERRVHVTLDAKPEILIGYHKPALPDPDDAVFEVMEGLLSTGRTSRLYKTLVEEKGLVQKIDAMNGFPGDRYPNLFVISASPRGSHSFQEVESALDQEILKLKDSPVSSAELLKVKNRIKMDLIRDLDSNEGIAGRISYAETIAGNYRFISRRMEMIDKVTPEDIIRTARQYLIAANRTVATLSCSAKVEAAP